MNPRYVYYAEAHGLTAGAMMRYTAYASSGAQRGLQTLGFVLWMSRQKQRFFAAHPEAFTCDVNSQPNGNMLWDYVAWDRWLQQAAVDKDRLPDFDPFDPETR